NLGWRIGFALGPIVGATILYMRRFVPESPRWLLTHGQIEEAEEVVREIEGHAIRRRGELPPLAPHTALRMRVREAFGLDAVVDAIFKRYLRRSIVAFVLMTAQAFLYNAIFFTYALVLSRYYAVKPEETGFYMLPFAISNFLGPLVLG